MVVRKSVLLFRNNSYGDLVVEIEMRRKYFYAILRDMNNYQLGKYFGYAYPL